MDTEAITKEIIKIRNRLDELDEQVEDASGTDIDDERDMLEEKLRFRQDQLSADGTNEIVEQDEPAAPKTVHYLPPA